MNENTVILFRVSEKLTIKLKIVRHENINLRKIIIHEKKKRKRGKVIYLYNSNENEE